ncbi:MAG TPA: cupin-like domain-containing protein, partial [Magnetospirillaceae bacterium]|nr:cupin-like domain-containing protein [Magnetospirillaceae bacterium]
LSGRCALKPVTSWPTMTPQRFHEEVLPSARPALLPAYCRHWPAVQAGLVSDEKLRDTLLVYDAGIPFQLFAGPPGIKGRLFYNDDLSGLNFSNHQLPLADFFDRLLAEADNPQPSTLYSGSIGATRHLPGFCENHSVGALMPETMSPLITTWIGNRAIVAAHMDYTGSLACGIAGHRRFTLFPPDQIANLYMGPVEMTPAGQPICLADLRNPDFARYPRLEEALAAAETAELEPGDVLFVPALWWHQVESLSAVNFMLNYRWRDGPAFLDPPGHALMAALIGIRDLPAEQRAGWRAIFDHLIFQTDGPPYRHLPPSQSGVFGNPLTAQAVLGVKAMLADAYAPAKEQMKRR